MESDAMDVEETESITQSPEVDNNMQIALNSKLVLPRVNQKVNYTFVYYFVKLITCHELTEFVVYQTKKMANYKAPPVFKEDMSCEALKKELAIWTTFTDLDKKKLGPSIFLSLNGKPRASDLEHDIGVINGDKGVEAILEQLDKLYLKDKHQTAYLAYEAFEKFQRPVAMSMTDFINEFERMYHKLKQHKMELPDGVLAIQIVKKCSFIRTA